MRIDAPIITGSFSLNGDALIDLNLLTTTGSNTFIGNQSIIGAISASALTGSIDFTNLTNSPTLVSGSSQVIDILSSLNSVTASFTPRISNLESKSSSVDISITNINSVTASNIARLTNLESKSASVDISITNINSYTSSQDTKNTTLGSYTGSNDTKWTSIGNLTGSYATTGSNTFFGTQTYSGSVYIANDLIVQGSSSIQYISASSVSIGTNIVQLNTANPSVRYAGLSIVDSGSIGGSGSFLYDSVHDEFVFVHRGNGTNVTSSHFVLGPETYDSLGNETYLTTNILTKGTGKEHLVDSCIFDNGTTTCIKNNLVGTGTICFGNNTIISGSVGIRTLTPRASLHVQQTTNDGVPNVGCARDGLIVSSNNGNYGLNIGVDPTGPTWMQAMRFDDGATAYNLLLQPTAGCSVLIGTGTALAGCRQQLVIGGNTFGSVIGMGNNANGNKFLIENDSSENVLFNNKSNTPMIFYTCGCQRFTITANGSTCFSCSITAQSGILFPTTQTINTAGSMGFNATQGIFIYGKTGTSYDFKLYNGVGSTFMQIPTGTQNVEFLGNITATSELIIGGNSVLGNGKSSASVRICSNNSTATYLYFNGAGVTSDHTKITGLEGATSNLRFYTSNTQRLSINSSGFFQLNGAGTCGDLSITNDCGFAWIYTADQNHSIIMRGNRNGVASDYTNYHQYGGNLSTGKGHLFWTDGTLHNQTLKMQIANDGIQVSVNFAPSANNTYSLGTSSCAWSNIYTNDLHLNNEGKCGGNDVDGTNGNWTIQEGAENLYIINNKNNKKFKIQLQEII